MLRLRAVLPGFDLRVKPVQPRSAGCGAGADPRTATPGHRPDRLQPLHAGLLAGACADSTPLDPAARERREAHREQLEAYEGLCAQLGASSLEVALAWLRHNPVLSSAIVGATSVEQVRPALGGLSLCLDEEVQGHLNRIWPGPGEAPQAYAW
ncbi:aldo/keto reductase [Nonomuraea sp. GTA35]|uniref:aldo/keto reductase n=1 Tax=Nonomuraea sp. GTA35 TaxID=1676746 RepID=UPI0035C19FCC